jgi:hypothetical protein
MKSHGHKAQIIIGVLLIIFGLLAGTSAIFFTPTIYANYLSQDHTLTPDGFNQFLILRYSIFLVGILFMVCGSLFIMLKKLLNKAVIKTILFISAIVIISLLLGSFSTYQYVIARGIDYLEKGNQIKRQIAVMNGTAGNPWQYRVLAPYVINLLLRLFDHLHIPNYISVTFIFVRVVQDTLIMLLSYAYYRKFGLSMFHALLGMAVLAWGMSYSHYDSDLSSSTFFDIIFYLLAGLSILQFKFYWIIPITIFAALNRETSALIPVILLIVTLFVAPKGSFHKTMPLIITAFTLFVAIFVILRVIYGKQELIVPFGHHVGIELLNYNLFRNETWIQIFAALSIIPVIAILGYKHWTPHLRVFFWVIVPIWLIVHAFSAVMAEARLFLVPQAMVFIPGALLSLKQQVQTNERHSSEYLNNA